MTIAITDARFQSFGLVGATSTTVGTRMTANLTDPAAVILCQAFSFQATSAGTGVIYICNTATPDLTDGVQGGVLWEVPPPSASPVTRPLFAIGNPTGPDPLNASELFILPSVSGEKLRCVGMR